MRDGPGRRYIKGVARGLYELGLALRRTGERLAGQRPRYELGGACHRCARCCEEPSIQIGRVLWYLPRTRALFVAWQRVVNGFELVRAEREGYVLAFRCTHFDTRTRLCDSYESRPGMCRDYPRILLGQPWPELFEGCGYRVLDRRREGFRAALDATDLDDAAKADLRRKLRLDDPG